MSAPERRCASDRTRAEDHSRAGRLLAWWKRWGLLVQAAWLIFITGVLTVAIVVYAGDQHDAAINARRACERTQAFGPPLANAYDRFHILTPEQTRAYRDTIPAKCA